MFEAHSRTLTFRESANSVNNPERGFSWAVDLFDGADFAIVRARHGVTLIRANGRLDAYREQDLPETLLATFDARLAEARTAGVKLIMRFSYNEGPHPNSEPDASLVWIKRHIAQLAPYLKKHGDIIAWMEAGFIGAWGEWHTSTNGHDRDINAKRDVVHALLAALPPTRGIQLRSPSDLAALHGLAFTYDDAHTGSAKSRTGHHNDCFLASDTDSGTYGRGGRTAAEDKGLVAAYGQFTPIGGETCSVNPPRSECPTALAELEALGYSELNLAYNRTVLDSWREGGCFEAIRARMGYRLVLESITLPSVLTRGTNAAITLRLKNAGFAAPLLPRPVYLLLEGPAQLYFKLGNDPRWWLAGRTHAINALLAIPAGVPPGDYSLSLWMPDDAPALIRDTRYAIQLANDGVWDARTGSNRLADTVPLR
jgi:Domain of unknown function (DUF4832)/Domain of unknown function (DUF4874)